MLAKGFKEIETLTTVDLLRRAKIKVVLAALDEADFVAGRSHIAVQAKTSLPDTLKTTYDIIIHPGVPGTHILRNVEHVIAVLTEQNKKDMLAAGICVVPLVFLDAGMLEKHRSTGHFSTREELPAIIKDQPVVLDGNIITSQGVGTAIDFGLAIMAKLMNSHTAEKVRKDICLSTTILA